MPALAIAPTNNSLDSSCEELINANGIIVKFKQQNNFLFQTKSPQKNLTDDKNAKKYLERILARKIKTIDKVHKRSLDIANSQRHKFNLSAKQQHYLSLIEKSNLDSVYLIDFKLNKHKKNKKLSSNSNKFITVATSNNASSTYACEQIEKELSKLNKNPEIEYAEPNLKVQTVSTNDPFYNSKNSWGQGYDDLWGIKKIQADQAWSITEGQGIIVAVIDSGVDYNHPDLWDNIWVDPSLVSDRNADGKINLDDLDLNANKFIDPNEYIEGTIGRNFVDSSNTVRDFHGHGTHVAGTIAAVRNNNIGVVGVAPKARILAVKGLSDEGSGVTSDLAEGIVYAAGIADLSNNSYGAQGTSKLLQDAFQLAVAAGMINIAAAGNNAMDAQEFTPANLDSVITVAATNFQDERASFSNYGFKIDIAAPGGGNVLPSTDPNTILSTAVNDSKIAKSAPYLIKDSVGNIGAKFTYMRIAGTSMAAPHVAAVAALALAKIPNLSTEEMRAVLKYSVDPVNSNQYIGTGRINALKAVSLNTAPPVAKLNSITDKYIYGKVNLSGTASSPKFSHYNIYWKKPNDLNWTQLPINSGNSPVVNDVLVSNLDTSLLAEGPVLFKLEVHDTDNLISTYAISANILNFSLTSLYNNDIYRHGSLLNIKGIVGGITNANSVEVRYKRSDSSTWQNSGVNINNVDFTSRDPQTLATIDTNYLETDTFYDFSIKVNKTTGEPLEETKRFIYFDSQLKPGFPADIDRSDYAQYRESRNVGTFDMALMSNYQSLEVADLNNDGKKEIITLTDFAPAVAGKDLIPIKLTVYSHEGKILWIRELRSPQGKVLSRRSSGESEELAIADLNNDGYKEIVVSGGYIDSDVYVFALDYQGKDFPFWPLKLNRNTQGGATFFTAVVDLDRDGEKEIILKQNKNVNWIWKENPTTGQKEMFRTLLIVDRKAQIKKEIFIPFPFFAKFFSVNESLAFGNFDNDKDLEIVVDYGYDEIAIYNMDGSLVSGWPFRPKGHAQAGFAVADVNKDGYDEIAFTTIEMQEFCSFYTALGETEMMKFLCEPQTENQIYLLDKNSNNLSGWPIKLGEADPNKYRGPEAGDFSNPVFADIDADGDLEIALPCTKCEYQQYLFHHDGSSVAGWPLKLSADPGTWFSYNEGRYGMLSNTIADVNNDGQLDIINVTGSTKYINNFDYSLLGGIFAWNKDGSQIDLNPHPQIKTLLKESINPEGKRPHTPYFDDVQGESTIIDDLDGDGFLDIIYASHLNASGSESNNPEDFTSKDRGSIYAWSLKTPANKKSAPWSRIGFDLNNTYNYGSTESITEIKPDSMAPTMPQNLAVAMSAKNYYQVLLTWSAATDNVEVYNYNIYRDGTLIDIIVSSKLEYIDANLDRLHPNIEHIYQVSAVDAAGNESTKAQVTFLENKPPIANFVYYDPSGGQNIYPDTTIKLYSQSSDPEDKLTSYSWDFNNDGVIDSTERDVTRKFSSVGSYPVKLTVVDNHNSKASITKTILVKDPSSSPTPNPPPPSTPNPPVTNKNPTAIFSFTPSNPDIQTIVSFNASSSIDFDGSIVAYQWDWNNDNINDAFGQVATHLFTEPGTYSVKLTVSDNLAAKNSLSQTITVNDISRDLDPHEEDEQSFKFNSDDINIAIYEKTINMRKTKLLKFLRMQTVVSKTDKSLNSELNLALSTNDEFFNYISFGNKSNLQSIPLSSNSGYIKIKLQKCKKFIKTYGHLTSVKIPITVTDINSGYLETRFIQLNLR